MSVKISFSKYGKREFEESGLTLEELKESVERTMQREHEIGYVYCETINRDNIKLRPDGTVLSDDEFLLQGVRKLYPYKIEQNGKVEVVWKPKVEGPTAREYFTNLKKAKSV